VGARALQGWALRSAGRPEDAADAFLASAREATGERAADTLWNAVLCLDEAARAGRPGAVARANAVVDRVVAEHEGTGAAVRAHAWRVVRADVPRAEDVEALLAPSVPLEFAPAARRAAIEGLYRRFRALEGVERVAAARRALRAADDEAPLPGAEGTLDIRRRLEMSVATGDRARGAEALAALESRAEGDAAVARALDGEIAARRAQVALLERRTADALAAARTLAPETPWGRVAWQAAREAVAQDPGSGPLERAIVARAVALGAPPAEREGATVAAWARAEGDLLAHPDAAARAAGDAAGALAAVVVAAAREPTNADLALAEAALRIALGERERGLEALRDLLPRLPVGGAHWTAAKALQVRTLAAQEPRRARQVLDQARALVGAWGDGPSAEELRALDRALPRSDEP
jgi:hypothetical protein